MRIKRTDRDFTVRQKADRKIHYAGQGKKYTEKTANFSPKEKQNALRQKNIPGAGAGIQVRTQIQRKSSASGNIGNSGADDTAKSYQQEYGNGAGGSNGSNKGNVAVFGNLHVKRLLQGYQIESVSHKEPPAGNRQPEQHQGQQQVQRPSAYHENTIKTKETVLHRKADVPFSIKREDGFILKERKSKKEKAKKPKPVVMPKAHREKRTGEFQQEKPSGNISTDNKVGDQSATCYTQSFSDRRDAQISDYKRKKFFKLGKQKSSSRETGRENAKKKSRYRKRRRKIKNTRDIPAGSISVPNAEYRGTGFFADTE